MAQGSIATILLISCLVACGADPTVPSATTRELGMRQARLREWRRSPEGIRSRLCYRHLGAYLSSESGPDHRLKEAGFGELDEETLRLVTSDGVLVGRREALLEAYAYLRAHRFDSTQHFDQHERILEGLAFEHLLQMPVLVPEDRMLSLSAKESLIVSWRSHLDDSDAGEFAKAATFFAAAEPNVSMALLVDAFVLDPTDERLGDALAAIAGCWSRQEEKKERDEEENKRERQMMRAMLVRLHDAARSDGQRQAVRSRYIEYFPKEAPR